MTIYFKNRCSWVQYINMQQNSTILSFYMIDTKYITRQSIWVNMFTVYVIHHIGITKEPHDHLFQKSRKLGAIWVHKPVSKRKSTNLSFFFMIETKCITRQFIWVNLFTLYVIHYIGTTQRPHDHLFPKSRQLGATQVHKQERKQKSTNLSFFLYD